MIKRYTRVTCAKCGTKGQSNLNDDDTNQSGCTALGAPLGWYSLDRGYMNDFPYKHEWHFCCIQCLGGIFEVKLNDRDTGIPDYTGREVITEMTCDICGCTKLSDKLNPMIGGTSSWKTIDITNTEAIHVCGEKCYKAALRKLASGKDIIRLKSLSGRMAELKIFKDNSLDTMFGKGFKVRKVKDVFKNRTKKT